MMTARQNCPPLSVSTEIFKHSNTHATTSISDDSKRYTGFANLYNEGHVFKLKLWDFNI